MTASENSDNHEQHWRIPFTQKYTFPLKTERVMNEGQRIRIPSYASLKNGTLLPLEIGHEG